VCVEGGGGGRRLLGGGVGPKEGRPNVRWRMLYVELRGMSSSASPMRAHASDGC
jgi:hypothetical protein